jgi:AcrR family transcriptional regulator
MDQGYDATTVEQVAAAGISPRSFFRYFPTKEDVVIGDPVPPGLALLAALEARPRTESAGEALRHAMRALVEMARADPFLAVQTAAIMLETPALRARHLEKQFVWERMLTPDIIRRLGADSPDANLRAHAIVSSALSCLDAALNEWASGQEAQPLAAVSRHRLRRPSATDGGDENWGERATLPPANGVLPQRHSRSGLSS